MTTKPLTISQALAAANKVIMSDLNRTMETDIFEYVRQLEVANIEQRVYDAYAPTKYKRRGDVGGIGDIENIVLKDGKAQDGVIEVINITPANPGGVSAKDAHRVTTDKRLDLLIEYGQRDYKRIGIGKHGYDFPADAPYTSPRHFTYATRQKVKKSYFKVLPLLQYSMRNKGYVVEFHR